MKASKTVNAKSHLYAILGDPIEHSMSPVMMNASFNRDNLDKVFLAIKCNCENAHIIIPALKEIQLKGYVITMPLKEVVSKYIDDLQNEALLSKVVNCIILKDGKLIGYNTDSIGFYNAIREKMDAERKIQKAFVMGMGGFSKSVVTQCVLQGIKNITVTNKFEETDFLSKFEEFKRNIIVNYPDVKIEILDWNPCFWKEAVSDCDIIVNATANGLCGKGDLHEIFPYGETQKNAVFFDAVYTPLNTDYLLKAKDFGFITVNGIDLLAHQGCYSYKLFTGIDIDPQTMRDDVLNYLNTK